jgi:hypothetical protein
MVRRSWWIFFLACGGAAACSTGGHHPSDGTVDGGCLEARLFCEGDTVYTCSEGSRQDIETCGDGLICLEDLGCVACRPGWYTCDGQDVMRCRDDGTGYAVEQTCEADQVCSGGGTVGVCRSACDEAIANRSNIGCDYWAVDLDNAESHGSLLTEEAWSEQFAVAIANPSPVAALVRVFVNDAPVG